MKITTVGIDLAKNVFLIHGVDERGRTVVRKSAEASRGGEVLCESGALFDRDGSVCERALLGS